MSIAFCIGNGESRQGYDTQSLKQSGKIFGANAYHRDHVPDFLVCCDKRMVQEALNNKNYTGPIYTRPEWISTFANPRVLKLPNFSWNEDLKWRQHFHWGSGLHAVHLACKMKNDIIICIGHDMYGIDNRHNNIYKGTNNYEAADHHAVDPSFWIKQFLLLFDAFPKIQFFICQPDYKKWQIPETWCNKETHVGDNCILIRDNVFIQELGDLKNELGIN